MNWRQRKTVRSTLRPTCRRLNRSCLRGNRRGPDDLAQACTAFGRAIRAHRRLARLAPRYFDAAVVDRERQNHAEQRRWMALWEPALAKVYGVKPESPAAAAELPPLPPPRIQAEVERQLAERELWVAAGHAALERQQQRRPHAVPSLARLTRLVQVAMDFKNLALGLASQNPLPEKISYDYEFTDLKRAYGHHQESPAPVAVVPADPVARGAAAVPASELAPGRAAPPAPPPTTLPPAPAPSAIPRCDAWRRWSRQVQIKSRSHP